MEQLLWVDGRVCTTRMRQDNSHGHMPKALRRCARSQDVPKRTG